MKNENVVLEKVALVLIFLVGAILIFTQYQFIKLMAGSIWNYVGLALILGLVAIIFLLAIDYGSDSKNTVDFTPREKPKPWTQTEKVSYGIVAVVAILIIFNQVQISQASSLLGISTPLTFKSSSSKTSLALTGDPSKDAISVVISRGTPFYGAELGVSFDDPVNGLEKIAQLDPAYGRNKIQWTTAEQKARYIKIGMTKSVGCEYCCGADTSVDSSGRPTCGCKHSWAMRGLSAFLIKNHPELTDEEIIREISKWKGLFFPKQMVAKYIKESQTGQYTPDISSLLMDIDESKFKEGKTSVAAGNSNTANDVPADLNNLPNMVGGC